MGWGAMMGLGQSLQQVGGMIDEHYKTKLANKLEMDKEQRAADRKLAEENRQRQLLLTDPDPTQATFDMTKDGLMKTSRNHFGTALDQLPASQSDVDAWQMNKDKEKASLEKTLADTAKSKKELENFDSDHALEQDYKRSQIQYNKARGLGVIMGGSGSTKNGSLESTSADQEANVLMDTYSDLIKQYTTPQDKNDPSSARMSQAQAERVALSVVKQATISGNRDKLGTNF